MAGNRAKQKKLEMKLRKSRTQLDKLQLEIGKSLTGDSVYTAEDLSQAIGTLETRISDSEKELSSLKEEEARKKQGVDKISAAYNQFKSWANGMLLEEKPKERVPV